MFRPPLQNGHGQRWTVLDGACPDSPGMLELVRYQRTVFEYGGTGDTNTFVTLLTQTNLEYGMTTRWR